MNNPSFLAFKASLALSSERLVESAQGGRATEIIQRECELSEIADVLTEARGMIDGLTDYAVEKGVWLLCDGFGEGAADQMLKRIDETLERLRPPTASPPPTAPHNDPS